MGNLPGGHQSWVTKKNPTRMLLRKSCRCFPGSTTSESSPLDLNVFRSIYAPWCSSESLRNWVLFGTLVLQWWSTWRHKKHGPDMSRYQSVWVISAFKCKQKYDELWQHLAGKLSAIAASASFGHGELPGIHLFVQPYRRMNVPWCCWRTRG